MKKKKAIVSVTNDLYTDQRVHKVATFLHENGYDVTLVGRLLPTSKALDRAYKTHRMKLSFHKGALFYANYNLRLFFYLLFHKADVLLSNDLDTLLANFMAKQFKRKCELVYDSHEYYTEVPELVARPKIKAVWEAIEGFIFPKLNKIYTVNQSIADKYSKKYNKDLHIIRNISPLWKPKNILSKEELGIDVSKKMIILQGAGINIDRGAEEAVMAMKYIENTVLYFVGSGDIIEDLKDLVQKENLEDKVVFKGRRPYDEMMNFTYHADLGLTLDKDTNLNYKFSLPNKVFDYIHTTTPILASNVIEVTTIVKNYEVGDVIDNHQPEHIAEKIKSILENSEKHAVLCENCRKTAQVLNWESESQKLKEIYTLHEA
ncbi:Glycosyltransferase involved in cell wall bisynthesis [Lishizhenia tianjinensis]|uniref:Glycosyltransferase involved in cell wall bisynthesis n=1 Tax=Lishizhenia tianjinensis TaxID=477690 RepID=A0A1I7BAV2_9FLAO|nr:glycosyltransferase [Lishizhenia tianjinensis]SFT84349.1 Glycosyltransferase involved in cell wall bisynthesis [Lishizhenia tianjinensis]